MFRSRLKPVSCLDIRKGFVYYFSGSAQISWPKRKSEAPTISRSLGRKRVTSGQGPSTDSPRVFSFGSFSQLNQPSRKVKDSLAVGLNLIDSFDALRLFPTVRAAVIAEIKDGYHLKSPRIASKDELQIKPSPVQIAAIRKICRSRSADVKRRLEEASPETIRNDSAHQMMTLSAQEQLKVFTLAAETGLGKTWAYLAPLISILKETDYEQWLKSPKNYAKTRLLSQIRAVVLVPTHELVEQVYSTLNRANSMRFDSKLLNAASKYGSFMDLPENKNSIGLKTFKWVSGDPPSRLFDVCNKGERIDVLVTTPGKIAGLSKLVNFHLPLRYFRFVEFCVIDEADTLFDHSWQADTTLVLRAMHACRDLVLCLATIPKAFKKTLGQIYPHQDKLIQIATPSLHKIPTLIKVRIIDPTLLPYNGLRVRCLAQALYAISRDGTEPDYVKRILVFVNNKLEVQSLVENLTSKYFHRTQDVIGITGDMNPRDRSEAIAPFLTRASLIQDDPDSSKVKVLVTTDLMSRGLDFSGIKNVVLMDLPRLSVDLVHRIGRTGRMRQSGRVFVIVDQKSRKLWIASLPTAIKRGFIIG